ncbi:Sensors of blue-light using FAD [Microlunatus sagamiharensis]|uniref:Sensors of blue-light using FAD n=1 Tax=Microlunatus sagamiharensis TaxID=546874 RepID=A0A1H2N8M4_9ACTN|nr:BLUF domain-containing protein [Microlunatus sagamiharensis]SDV01146.1 Sensors of blue-light using FAD [Microlunatus sagamiharensis]
MLYTAVYVSSAVGSWSTPELSALLAQSRAKNTGLGITGVLLHREGSFMQVLEGEEDVVRPLYNVIAHDPRHADVVNVWSSLSPHRRFGDWSMGFRDLDSHPVDLPGYTDVLEAPPNHELLRRRLAAADFLSKFVPVA